MLRIVKRVHDEWAGAELLGRKVEIVTKESLSPYPGPHILAEVEYVCLAA